MSSFKHNGETVTLKFNWRMAKLELPSIGLRLLNLIEGENIQQMIENVILNDDRLLDLYYCFIRHHQGVSFSEAMDELDKVDEALANGTEVPTRYVTFIENIDDINPFREALWEAIENFTPVQLRPLLRTARQEVVKALQQAPEVLKQQSSAMLDEAKSTPASTQSGS